MFRVRRFSLPVLCSMLLLVSEASAVERTGQIVCSECWSEEDRNRVPYGTRADLDCAQRCAARDVPISFAVKIEGGYELYRLEGQRDWKSLVGRFAVIDGSSAVRDGLRRLTVDSLELVEGNPWFTETPTERADASLGWTDLQGERRVLEEYRGEIVVLNFWATWCAPCRDEMPDLVRIQNRYGMYGVQVVGASADSAEVAESVGDFARKLKINFPVLLGATTDQMRSLGVGDALPATVVLDREGRIVDRIRGVVDRRRLESRLDRLVRGETIEVAALSGHDHGHRHAGRRGQGTQASLVPS